MRRQPSRTNSERPASPGRPARTPRDGAASMQHRPAAHVAAGQARTWSSRRNCQEELLLSAASGVAEELGRGSWGQIQAGFLTP